MRYLVFDDLGVLHTKVGVAGGELEPFGPLGSESIDQYFADHCAQRLRNWKAERHGLIVLHAHGKFSENARRQDLQGVELLKHIRLSPWLDHVSSWHAIVCSFEPLDQILSRRPGNLILTSPGVTFLRLPQARGLVEAVRDNYGDPNLSLERLARVNARLDRRSFRPFVACAYWPPDSAHETSNLWGLYEMWPTRFESKFPEVDASPDVDATEDLPADVKAFVLSLPSKMARWLEGERTRAVEGASKKAIESLRATCKDKRIVLVDDEAERGWAQLLRLLVNGHDGGGADCSLWTPDPVLLVALRKALASKKKDHASLLKEIAAQIHEQKADLVVLDEALCKALASEKDHASLLKEIAAQIHEQKPDLVVLDEALRKALTSEKDQTNLLKEIAAQIHEQKPDLVVLDLRLCGSEEFATPPAGSTGMELARLLRAPDPFLPMLLFTASNKAETLLISNSYDVDEYWMKPGLGEHRGLGSRQEDFTSLTKKIERLLGPDYCWLQRMALDLSAIKTASAEALWWERTIKWPDPIRTDGRPISGITNDEIKRSITQQVPRVGIRIAVLELLLPIMVSFRIALRLEQRDSNRGGPPTPELLRAGIFNQIGKVVELVHGFTDGGGIRDDLRSAGTVGGRSDTEDKCFVFIRQDWWAFRLFAQRNEWSHVRVVDQSNRFAVIVDRKVTGPSKEDAVAAMSDLVAWLIVPRVKVRSQEVIGTEDQRFQLSPGDRLAAGERGWTKLTSRSAASRGFQDCMARRQEYQQLIGKAEDLKTSFRRIGKR